MQEEANSFEQEDQAEPIPPADIVAYNELRSCADLFRLHFSGKLEIQPDFQREVVWKKDEQTRFIDSLVKQLPIPSMCFSLDYKTQRWKVIDGLQRMSSIIRFLGTDIWRLSNLVDIHPDLRSQKNLDLRNGTEIQRRLFSLVEDVSIPITVIRCDYSQKSHMRYLFTIFHRLNSGGVRLNNQEIRNCIYNGHFNDLLRKFDESDNAWTQVKKRIWGSTNRFRSIEILLRMCAFSEYLNEYDGNLARFLNDYMHSKMDFPLEEFGELTATFDRVTELAYRTLDDGNTQKIPLTLVEALLVALYTNIHTLNSVNDQQLRTAFKEMKQKVSFAENARYAVSSADNVKTRLGDAVDSFRGL
jgi:hypothetical protein